MEMTAKSISCENSDSTQKAVVNDALFGVEGATGRGFPYVEFLDENGKKCSIQESSRAVFENEDGTVNDPLGWIWLGIDTERMHLNETQVRGVIARLTLWLETGSLMRSPKKPNREVEALARYNATFEKVE